MSDAQVVLLGGIAGATIFIGLPVGRAPRLSSATRALLNALAIGILLFLLWDILSHAIEPVEHALTAAAVDHNGTWLRFAGLATTFTLCLGAGLLSLVYYDRWLSGRPRARREGPGAALAEELRPVGDSLADEASRLALLIAVGIGLHNFSEGLAIGQSAATGKVSLALLLIVGFGLHNATEGFGIVAPMSADGVRPSWLFLGGLGLIGGGPTFAGTIVGQSFVNDTVFLGFLALAAGSILYVVLQLVRMAFRMGHREVLMWGVLLGFLAGLATDFVLVAAGV
ncbi:MAG: putative metal cation transporter [Acidimicrobiales bacterium]|nr:putative metal cation transporter [Acidimicrobiales bacterium]